MAIAMTITSVDISRRRKSVHVQAALSGNYAAGGEPVDLTTLANPQMIQDGQLRGNPVLGVIEKYPAGSLAELIPGATPKTWFLKVFSAPGTELAAGAYPAGIAGDTCEFVFQGQIGTV